MPSQMGLEPTIFGSGNRRLVHLATGTTIGEFTSSGTRTHNLTLRRGAPYPLGHGGVQNYGAGLGTAPVRGKNKTLMPGVGFEPTRTNAQQILSLPP